MLLLYFNVQNRKLWKTKLKYFVFSALFLFANRICLNILYSYFKISNYFSEYKHFVQ